MRSDVRPAPTVQDDDEAAGQVLPPVAPLLMQSLRAIGYTAPAALADLVDNSITAGAATVAIQFAAVPEPFIAIVDDGSGLGPDSLVAAMRFGSRDPRDVRGPSDLGRFGLGLKTASLSQCRRVTVASMSDGRISLAVWDLDECERRGTWWLGRPDASSIPREVIDRLEEQGRGTAVVWQELDRLMEGDTGFDPRRLENVMEAAADHLALVFHRFLSGEMARPFSIMINGRPLPRLDPFLDGHPRGQGLHEEVFTIEGHPIRVSPFVLPFPSRLKPSDIERAGGREGIKTGHGFYIYRGGRLIVPGGWFRIVPSDELIRLARIRVDVPVELDHIWKIDVRKTTAEPPQILRPHLKRIVGAVTSRSRKVYTHRGTPANTEHISLWTRNELRDGAAAWRINRAHPAVVALARNGAQETDIGRLLRLLEESLPVHDIHIHMSNDLPVADPERRSEEDLQGLACHLLGALEGDAVLRERLLDKLHVIEPFNSDPDAARRIAERLRHA